MQTGFSCSALNDADTDATIDAGEGTISERELANTLAKAQSDFLELSLSNAQALQAQQKNNSTCAAAVHAHLKTIASDLAEFMTDMANKMDAFSKHQKNSRIVTSSLSERISDLTDMCNVQYSQIVTLMEIAYVLPPPSCLPGND
jgi:predicted DNA-binding protein YlxM (UPF0122 family)